MDSKDFTLDAGRAERLGFGEAVFCLDKSVRQIADILESVHQDGDTALLTRLHIEKLIALPSRNRDQIDYDEDSRTGYFGLVESPVHEPATAVITAGTSDVPVSREVIRTLRYYQEASVEICDVGVAGLWRLLERVDEIRNMPVVVVVAGMDAALPSVIGGLVPAAVIAVPTSTGYGVARSGETALRAALTSCAPGVTVVNIDNGYGAACAALRLLRHLRAGRRI